MRSATLFIAASISALALAGCHKPATAPAAAATPVSAATTPALPAATAQPTTATSTSAAVPASGTAAQPPKLRMACATDIQKFCAGSSEKPGKCLRPHMAEVSAQCSQAIAARRAARMGKRNGKEAGGTGKGADGDE